MDRPDRAVIRGATLPPTRPVRLTLPLVAALALVAAFLLPSAPARSADAVPTAQVPVPAAQVPVEMGDDFFRPENLSITAGDTVVWTNTGDDEHTATDTGNAFHSGTMNAGDAYQYTFDSAGTYDYVCAFHDDMTGTVTVTGSTAPPPPPPPPAPTVRVAAFGPNPFRLRGPGRLRATYAVGQRSTLRARIASVASGRTVYSYASRSTAGAGRVTYRWDGKTRRRDVRPGRYRFVTTVTDRQNRRVVSRREFRVVR
jgi:plastocyanin